MKKLKKFEVLESGRICSLEEMELSKIKGGKDTCESNYHSCLSMYGHCVTGISFITCEVNTSLTGFVSNGSDVFCDSGYTYTQCTSGISTKETCSSNGIYSTNK